MERRCEVIVQGADEAGWCVKFAVWCVAQSEVIVQGADEAGHQHEKRKSMKYFNNIQTLEELKRAYRRLAMQHHRAASKSCPAGIGPIRK